MVDLKTELKKIKERNKRVEADKAWETSWARILLITAFTYIAIGLYGEVINVSQPWLNAIIPAVAFLLSTLTLPYFKKLWLNRVYRR